MTPEEKTLATFAAALMLSPFQSYHEWSKAAGVSYTTLCNSRHSAFIPTVVNALKIAKAAGTTVEAIWGHLAEDQGRLTRKRNPQAVAPAQGDAEPNEPKRKEPHTD